MDPGAFFLDGISHNMSKLTFPRIMFRTDGTDVNIISQAFLDTLPFKDELFVEPFTGPRKALLDCNQPKMCSNCKSLKKQLEDSTELIKALKSTIDEIQHLSLIHI